MWGTPLRGAAVLTGNYGVMCVGALCGWRGCDVLSQRGAVAGGTASLLALSATLLALSTEQMW
jgi:hypothetical protein